MPMDPQQDDQQQPGSNPPKDPRQRGRRTSVAGIGPLQGGWGPPSRNSDQFERRLSQTGPQAGGTEDVGMALARQDPLDGYARGGSVRGYADGGEVDDDQEFYQPEEQQRLRQYEESGYEDPETERRKSARTGQWDDGRQTGYQEREQTALPSLQDSLNWLHKQFSPIGEAEAAPQTGYGSDSRGINRPDSMATARDDVRANRNAPDTSEVPAPRPRPAEPATAPDDTGYGSPLRSSVPTKPPSDYGGELREPTPAAGAPLDITPSPEAKATPDSPLGRRAAEQLPPQAPGEAGFGDLFNPFNQRAIQSDPHLKRIAEEEQFQGTQGWFGRAVSGAQKSFADMLKGDRAYTLPQIEEMTSKIAQNPRADFDKDIEDTYRDAVKTKGAAGGAEVLQAVRPYYDKLNSISHAALQANKPEEAAYYADKAHDALPNGTKQQTSFDKSTGMFTTSITGADGQAKTFNLTPKQFYEWRTSAASQFDHVAANGTARNLEIMTRGAGGLPEGYKAVTLPDGRQVTLGPKGEAMGVTAGTAPVQPSGAGPAAVAPAQDPRLTAAAGGFERAVTGGRAITAPAAAVAPVAGPGMRFDQQGKEQPIIPPPGTYLGPQGEQRQGPTEFVPSRDRYREAAPKPTGFLPDGSPYTDRPLVPGTNWRDSQQYAQDDRPGVRGYDAQGRTRPQAAPRPAAPSSSPAGGGTADIGPQPTQQAAPPDSQQPLNQPPPPKQAAAVLQTYRGNQPPWPAPQGQRWLRSPSTGMWRLG